MDLCEYRIMRGSRHPWEISRSMSLSRILHDAGILCDNAKILDVGCGDGFTISSVCGGVCRKIDAVDSSLTPELISRFASLYSPVKFYNSLSCLENGYDLITAFDVIEHNEDDVGFMKSIAKYAVPGASIVITAPAFQSLFSSHDVMLQHYRRYNQNELNVVATKAGLKVKQSGYLFGSLLLCRLVIKTFSQLFTQTKIKNEGLSSWQHGELLAGIVASFLSFENRLMLQATRYGSSPPGLTVWSLCQK